jgi:hypothetical protein
MPDEGRSLVEQQDATAMREQTQARAGGVDLLGHHHVHELVVVNLAVAVHVRLADHLVYLQPWTVRSQLVVLVDEREDYTTAAHLLVRQLLS